MRHGTCRRCSSPTPHLNRPYCSVGCEVMDRHEAVASGCWEWQGPISPEGYGRTGQRDFAHRAAYEVFVGPIPDGLTIDHLCRNRRCCNPEHLEPVTRVENFLRGIRLRPPIEACRRFGHPYGADTYVNSKGRKVCRECRRMREGYKGAYDSVPQSGDYRPPPVQRAGSTHR